MYRFMQPVLKTNVLFFSLYMSYMSFFFYKVSSVSLDIRTMIALLKYLKNISITDRLPMYESNTDVGGSLSRIYWYRREVIHCNKFTKEQFEDRWYHISEVR